MINKLRSKWYLIKYNSRARKAFLRRSFLALAALILIAVLLFVFARFLRSKKDPGIRDPDLPSYAHVVAIDASRGGESDTGHEYGSMYEKDINLDIALRIAEYLTDKGYKVILTREEDVYVSPQDRLDAAVSGRSELLVSISQGYSDNAAEAGVKTFVRSSSATQSIGFADSLRRAVAEKCDQKDLENAVSSSYILLRDTRIPAVVIQTSFASNLQDNRKMLSGTYRQKLAEALAEAIIAGFK